MYCDSCDLMFCKECSQKDEVPGVLICVGSDAREGCFMLMCETCADNQDEVCLGATNAKAFGAINVTKPQTYIFVKGRVAPQPAVKTAGTSSFAVIAMTSTAEIA